MKRYIQFGTLKNGLFEEALASSGYIPVDGRLSVKNAIKQGQQHVFKSLRKDDKTHGELRKGDFKSFHIEARFVC